MLSAYCRDGKNCNVISILQKWKSEKLSTQASKWECRISNSPANGKLKLQAGKGKEG